MKELDLFPYQTIDADWLSKKRFALLAHEMGLGKSAIAVTAAKDMRDILVVCPASATVNWQREFKKFDETRVKKPKVISYDYLVRHQNEFIKPNVWDVAILDEAHYLKQPTALRTRAVLGKSGVIHNSKKFWALTGTPAPNHAGELWTLLFTFGLTKLKYDDFVLRYCHSYTVSRYGRTQITGTNLDHIDEIKKMLAKVSIRRLKSEVLKDFPSIFHTTHYVQSSFEPFDKLPLLKLKLESELEKLSEAIGFSIDEKPDDILLALSTLAQSVSTLRRYHGLKKVIPAIELFNEELKNKAYEKIVIFAIHKDVIELLKNRLEYYGHGPVVISGETPTGVRQSLIDRFQTDASCRVFIGNIKAAGTAITLTAANQVAFVELEWTPGDNAQAAMRCHRIGQTRPVTVRHITLADSLDEKINAVLLRKTRELSAFISN